MSQHHFTRRKRGSITTAMLRQALSLAMTLALLGQGSFGGSVILAFSFATPSARTSNLARKTSAVSRVTTTTSRKNGMMLSRTLSSLRVLQASMSGNEFFFSEEDDDIVEEKADTRMVNGSWSNHNQFPSGVFPQPVVQTQGEEHVQDATATTTATTPSVPETPSFLSVDGNGTGGLMERSRGTGGAHPTLMIPSDVNPNMRMATPIDSGKETTLRENTTPSTVASYAALSALTRTSTPPATTTTPTTITSVKQDGSSGDQDPTTMTAQERRLVPFQGSSLMDATFHKANEGHNFHSAPTKITVKRFHGEESIMNEHREGFSKPEKHNTNQPLDHNHHITIDGRRTNTDSLSPSSTPTQRSKHQHPQQSAPPPPTRLVPFTGNSLMEEATRKSHDERTVHNTAKLVKFDGHSMMEQGLRRQQQEESQRRSNMLQQGRHKLVPYQKSSLVNGSTSPGHAAVGGGDPNHANTNSNNNGSGKVVLYNKKAAVASSVVHSPKREYYYIQFRPPTDATMARKTGLQVNTPISLWNERDKFLDS